MVAGWLGGMVIGAQRAKDGCTDPGCESMSIAFSMIVGGSVGFVVGGGTGLLLGTIIDSSRGDSRVLLGVAFR